MSGNITGPERSMEWLRLATHSIIMTVHGWGGSSVYRRVIARNSARLNGFADVRERRGDGPIKGA